MIHHPLKIAITQRRIEATENACAKDAIDSHWSQWFEQYWPSAQFLTVPNFAKPEHAARYVADWAVDLLILSGGEDIGTSPIRDAVEKVLLDRARLMGQPVIGICRGMQLLHVADGGSLHPLKGHVGSTHTLQSSMQVEVESVNSWHRWGITKLGPHWEALTCAADGSVEAMQHKTLPWLGLMWHPERPGGDLPQMWNWINNNVERFKKSNETSKLFGMELQPIGQHL